MDFSEFTPAGFENLEMHEGSTIDLNLNRILWARSTEDSMGFNVLQVVLQRKKEQTFFAALRLRLPFSGNKFFWTVEFKEHPKDEKEAIAKAHAIGSELLTKLIAKGMSFILDKEYTFSHYETDEEMIKECQKSGLFADLRLEPNL